MDALTDAIYSSVGSLSNPHRLAMTTGSLMGRSTTDDTIKGYLGYLEDAYLMENMLYNDLIRRGYSVDVGVVELDRVVDGKRQQSQYEIDFVMNTGQQEAVDG